MKTNYWVLNLRITTLLKILRTRKTNGGEIDSITYIEISNAAALLLKILKILRIPRIPLHKIRYRSRVAGPLLNLHSVRNDKGEVITIDIYHHILALRRKICSQLTENFTSFGFFQNQSSTGMIVANLGLLAAGEIQTAVYFAHYGRWKNYRPNLTEHHQNILVIPKNRWINTIKKDLETVIGRVIVERADKQRLKTLVAMGIYLLKAIWLARSSIFQSTNKPAAESIPTENTGPGKIMVNYAMGLLRHQRNDISFFYDGKLDLSRLFVYFKSYTSAVSESELQWMKTHGVSAIAAPDALNTAPGIKRWQPTAYLKQELAEVSAHSLKMLKSVLTERKKHSLWMVASLWKIKTEAAYWKDLFKTNNIKALVHSVPSVENFIPTLAISESGGLAVTIERSILFDYCTYIHNPPNDIHFVTGPYSLTQIPEPSFSKFTVQAGGINVADNAPSIEGLGRLRKNRQLIIAIFDEMPNDVFFGDSIRQLYEALLGLAKTDDRVGLLIKTKKPQVLGNLPEINDEVLELTRKNKCLLADWKTTASAAAASSGLVVSVPSTAAFESVITGTRTIVFNPMRSGSRLFHRNNGLNRRIFEDAGSMIAAIKKYADGQDHSIGDCGDIAPFIDPFRDGQGSQRIGNYLKWCLEGFDSGQEPQEAVLAANKQYSEKFGAGRVTDENSYEKARKKN